MGFSTPKTPFNLAEFLSQKGTPRRAHRPRFGRKPAAPLTEAQHPDLAETPESDVEAKAEPLPE